VGAARGLKPGAPAIASFGGLAEYGVAVRWNENCLKLAPMLLEWPAWGIV